MLLILYQLVKQANPTSWCFCTTASVVYKYINICINLLLLYAQVFIQAILQFLCLFLQTVLPKTISLSIDRFQ